MQRTTIYKNESKKMRIAGFSAALLSIVFEFSLGGSGSTGLVVAAASGPNRSSTTLLGQVGSGHAPEVESLAPASTTWLTQSGVSSAAAGKSSLKEDLTDVDESIFGQRFMNELAQSGLEVLEASLSPVGKSGALPFHSAGHLWPLSQAQVASRDLVDDVVGSDDGKESESSLVEDVMGSEDAKKEKSSLVKDVMGSDDADKAKSDSAADKDSKSDDEDEEDGETGDDAASDTAEKQDKDGEAKKSSG